MRFISLFVTAVLGLGLMAGPSYAQTRRTWVSGVGDDSKSCSRAEPCKSFAGALPNTTTGGEIGVIDPGNFGSTFGFTIARSISIVAGGVEAGVLQATNVSAAITVNLPNDADRVVIDGLDLDGQGMAADGIKIIGKGRVYIRNCKARNFTGNGVNLVGGANARVFVVDSELVNNGGGIAVQGAAGSRASIDRSVVVSNGFGIRVNGAGNVANLAFVERSFIDSNANAGVQVENASTVVISDSTLSGSSGPDLAEVNGGQAISYGNNQIRTGSPTQTLPPK